MTGDKKIERKSPRPPGVRTVQRNVTEANQSQAQHQRYSEFYQAIIASATEGICACHDVPEFPYVRFTVWNDRMTEITGYTMEEINTSGWYQTVYPDPEVQARAIARMDRMRQGDNLNQEEWEITRKDGQKRQLLISTRIVPGGETGVNVLAVMNDISERKKSEEETRRRANELAVLNALGREVSATLSLEQVSDAALKGMMNVVHPDLAFLFLRDGEKLILKGVEATQPGKWLEEIPEHRVGECLCGLAAHERKPIYSRDIFTDDRCTWEECKKAGFRSFAALPLLSGTEVIGILGLSSYEERDFKTQAGFLETFANQVAVALENARLFEQVKNELTDRKRAEEALKFERDQLLSLFDSIPQAIYVTDPRSYEILFVNQYLRELLGKDPVGGLCYKEFQGMDHPCEFCTNDIIFKLKGQPYRWEYHNPILNRDYDITDRIIKWPDGREVRFEIAMDITERKRAEEQLRESEEKFRALFNQSTEGIYLHDLEGRILDVNEMACAQSGYSREEWLGLTIFDGHPSQRTTNLSKDEVLRIWRQWAPGQRFTFEAEHKRKDGTVYPVEISTGIVRYKDQNVILAIVKDISERKRAEAELQRRAEELRIRNDALTRFNTVMVGRELRMIELKREVNELCLKLGEPPRYKIVTVPQASDTPSEERK